MRRRDLLKLGATALTGAALAACEKRADDKADAVPATKARVFNWKLVTAWPPNFPIFHDAVMRFASDVRTLSGGRLNIQLHAAGELVPALGTFDAVSRGMVQMGHSASYYWSGKVPAAQFFTAVPFGLNAQGMAAWLYAGGGLALWEEVYRPYNLVPLPMGNTGVQMGGWFNKKIERAADLRGLRMRIPGLGGKVMARAGANPVLLPGAEIYTALERGNVDAAEWVGPFHDERLGLHRAARYYYYPGWQEPGPVLELIVNRKAWEELPADLQRTVQSTAMALHQWMFAEFEARNHEALERLRRQDRVQLLEFPAEVLQTLRRHSKEVLDEEAARDAVFRKVYEAYSAFQSRHEAWSELSESAYLKALKL